MNGNMVGPQSVRSILIAFPGPSTRGRLARRVHTSRRSDDSPHTCRRIGLGRRRVYVRVVRQCPVTPAAGVARGLPRRESRRRGTQSGVEPGIVGFRLAAARETRRLHGQGCCRRPRRGHVDASGAARPGGVREAVRRQEPGDGGADHEGHHLPPLLHVEADHRRRHDDALRGRQVAARRSGHEVRARVQERSRS